MEPLCRRPTFELCKGKNCILCSNQTAIVRDFEVKDNRGQDTVQPVVQDNPRKTPVVVYQDIEIDQSFIRGATEAGAINENGDDGIALMAEKRIGERANRRRHRPGTVPLDQGGKCAEHDALLCSCLGTAPHLHRILFTLPRQARTLN